MMQQVSNATNRPLHRTFLSDPLKYLLYYDTIKGMPGANTPHLMKLLTKHYVNKNKFLTQT